MHESDVEVTIDVPLQSSTGLEQLVESVNLRIFARDVDTMERLLTVNEGKVKASINVPPGRDRVFELEASDESGRVLYFGADTVDVGQGLDQAVSIQLMPVVLLMRVSPLYQEVQVGSQTTVDILIYNVDSLFGAAFTLSHSPNAMRIDGWDVGDFLGSGQGIIFTGHLSVDTLAVSYTRKSTHYDAGESGWGRLATITLTPLQSGESTLSLSIHSDEALLRIDEMPVDGIESLALDGAVIVARGGK